MQQATDFLEESRALHALVAPLDADQLKTVTQFKDWTIEDVIGHLHMFDHAALLTLKDRAAFAAFMGPIAKDFQQGKSLLQLQYHWLGEMTGLRLAALWREGYEELAEAYSKADPKARLAWAGPDMSARSCITARQMETWAHGQEIFDVLGEERVDADRIRNIAHLGVTTFGWTFANRGKPVPDPAPFVSLTAPSGETWEWNEPQEDNRVSGSATGFCQVVTQTRNVADTQIEAVGPVAKYWMQNAQCFAGAVETPPAPGARFRMK